MLTISNLSIKHNFKTVISQFGITLFNGAVLEIIGSNGSGKTSLLKSICNINSNYSRQLLIDGTDVREYDPSTIFSYLGHKLSNKPSMTVLENLEFWAKLNDFELAIDAAIHTLGLAEYVDTEVYKLSAGWQKRLALARLLLSKAPIWILDEPFSNLDKEGKEILKNMILSRIYQNGIVVYSNHEQGNMPNQITINLDEHFNLGFV